MMASAGGEEDPKPTGQPGRDVSAGIDDHDVTAALFDSLGGADTSSQDGTRSAEHAPSAFPEPEHDPMEGTGGDDPINWGDMDPQGPGLSIHEDELEGMFMALDEEGFEMDGADAGAAAAQLESHETDRAIQLATDEVSRIQVTTTDERQAMADAPSTSVMAVDLNETQSSAPLIAATVEGPNTAVPHTPEDVKPTEAENGTKEAPASIAEIKEERLPAVGDDEDVTAALLDSLAGEDFKATVPIETGPKQAAGSNSMNPVPDEKTNDSTIEHTAKDTSLDHEQPAIGDDPSQEDGDKPTKSQPDTRLCVVCTKEPGKYKCPLCSAPFCSVACNRTHKENHPPVPEKPAAAKPAAFSNPAPESKRKREDDDPYGVLLEHRDDFQRLFKKYPNLENELSQISKATLRPPNGLLLPPKHKNQHGFHKKQRMWTKEEGLRKGAAVLRRARTDPGEKGDGVREYCELVLHLLSKPGGSKATRLVREEVVAGDSKVIEQLMKEEKDKD